jgi:hypothetical protein
MAPMARAAVVAFALLSLALSACEREQKGISEDMPAARAARARADAVQIAGAVRLYQATFGSLPDTLDALTQAQTAGGVTGGPFLARIPAPPAGWSAYEYAKQGEINFTVTSSGGGVTVTAP